MKKLLPSSLAIVLLLTIAFTVTAKDTEKKSAESAAQKTEKATFAAGCFWCVEAVLENLDGVTDVISGYTGGNFPDPTYEVVCSAMRKNDPQNHAEAVQIEFDPEKISYDDLLAWFWRLHDPTTLNRQGADAGTQYRSAVFYHGEAQKSAAEKSKKEAQNDFGEPIVTQVVEAGTFYPAEKYHQDYFRLNPNAGYCQFVIAPKLRKLKPE